MKLHRTGVEMQVLKQQLAMPFSPRYRTVC